MVYKYPICLCGGTLYPTDEPYRDNSGTGRYYKCDKCGAKVGIITHYYAVKNR